MDAASLTDVAWLAFVIDCVNRRHTILRAVVTRCAKCAVWKLSQVLGVWESTSRAHDWLARVLFTIVTRWAIVTCTRCSTRTEFTCCAVLVGGCKTRSCATLSRRTWYHLRRTSRAIITSLAPTTILVCIDYISGLYIWSWIRCLCKRSKRAVVSLITNLGRIYFICIIKILVKAWRGRLTLIDALCASVGLKSSLWTFILRRAWRALRAEVTFIAFVELLVSKPGTRTIGDGWAVIPVRTC